MDGLTILILGDAALEARVRGYLDTLQWSNCGARSIGESDEFCRIARQKSADIGLVSLNGPADLSTLEQMSERLDDLPLIALGESEQADRVTEAIRFGAQDYLPLASFNAQCLSYAICRAIQHKAKDKTRNEIMSIFESIVETVPMCICRTDKAGNFTHSMGAALSRLGLRQNELVGTNVAEGFSQLQPYFQKAIQGHLVEFTNTGENQGQPWAFKHFLVPERGSQRGCIHIAHDITDRHLAESQLRRTTAELQAIFRAFPDICFSLNEEGIILSYEVGESSPLPLPSEDFQGLSIQDLLPGGAGEKIREAISEVLRTHRLAQVEYSLTVRKRELSFEARLLPLPEHRIFVIIRDITERKQAEQALRESEHQLKMVADSMPGLVAYIDRERRYRFANRAYHHWFGQRPEDVIGSSMRELYGERAYDAVREYVDKTLQGAAQEFEVFIPYAYRNACHVHASYRPDFDEQGRVRGFFSLVRDITERREYEEREKRQLFALAHVSRLTVMGEMTSEMAHELAQPLTAISNYSEAGLRMLQAQGEHQEEAYEALSSIAAQASWARAVICRLRDFARREEPVRKVSSVNELVEDVMRLAAVEAQWNGVKVKTNLAQELPSVSVDKTMIEQVILNLVRNAIESMNGSLAEDDRQLWVDTCRSGPDSLEVRVSDTGPGVSEIVREKIFDPFFTTKADGMGMGLSISRSIIDTHGGRLWVTNRDEGGASFRFTLPVLN